MDIKSKNLEAIKRGFPELYARIKAAGEIRQDFLRIDKIETLTETAALMVELTDGNIVRLNSTYSPEHEGQVWAEAQDLKQPNLFLFGLGNGVFADNVIKRKSEKSRLLIYEPSAQLFMYILEQFDMTAFFQKRGVRVLVEGLNEDMYSGVLEEMLTYENMEKKSFFSVPFWSEIFPQSLKAFVSGYVDGIGRMMSNKNTIRRFLHILPYNQLYNLRFLEKNTVVPKLAESWERDVPVVIAGAAPSLKDEIDVIRKNRDKMFFFAVDSALPYLLSENIIPDAFICIEADKPMIYFEDERCRDIPLFARVSTTHRLLERHKGKKIFGYDDGLMEKLYPAYDVPVSTYRYGGNGATSLFAICKELDVQTVILTGQDMAYNAKGESHVFGRHEQFIREEKFLLQNNAGQTVQSRQDWYRFVKWYENAILACQFQNVINTSLYGVKIAGAVYQPLEQALAVFGREHSSMQTLLDQTKSTFDGGKRFRLSVFYDNCQKELSDLAQMEQKEFFSNSSDYYMKSLLELYGIAGKEETLYERYMMGISALQDFLNSCMDEMKNQ